MKGSVYLPQMVSEFLPAMWVVGLPGGTSRARAYYDRQVPGQAPFAYSMARSLAYAGIGVLLFDTLGTGENALSVNGKLLTRQVLGAAYAQLVTMLRHHLVEGTLLANLAPVASERLWLAGAGHSMGGLLLTHLQGTFHCFDATLILGWAQSGVETPGVDFEQVMSRWPNQQGFLIADKGIRKDLRPFFYSKTVPLALIQADEREACAVPMGLLEALARPAALAAEARQIQGPLYLQFAERDVTSSPREETGWYTAASPITVAIQPEAAHCANFGPHRSRMWAAQVSWCQAMAHLSKMALDTYGLGSMMLTSLEAGG